ncbi:hypothetical protein [Methanofollis fontis]|uniref:Uncharacterized protein n=1 Tax=Methanofollis fontis TaxID=2052832 RepID=A0A483CN54_9EURY|nr:hypothetical protein [Methanofollis fontis]TAJ44052.1 hypothetical protein CUJ86_08430 [Methanofollis fontis]
MEGGSWRGINRILLVGHLRPGAAGMVAFWSMEESRREVNEQGDRYAAAPGEPGGLPTLGWVGRRRMRSGAADFLTAERSPSTHPIHEYSEGFYRSINS